MSIIKLRSLAYMFAAALVAALLPSLAVAQQSPARAPRSPRQPRVVVAPAAPPSIIVENGEIQTPEMNLTIAPMPPMPPMGFEPMTFNYISSDMSFGGIILKGAPYSAEAVSETIQILADGNRIVRKSTSNIYRDSEGRTRREQESPHTIGNFFSGNAPTTEARRTIFINDPVSGVNYVLDSKARTARKHQNMEFNLSKVNSEFKAQSELLGKIGQARILMTEKEVEARFAPNNERRVVIVTSKDGQTKREELTGEAADKALKDLRERHGIKGVDENTKTESLGKRDFDGVEAEGTRTTRTIPAGEIGNDRPIEIASERWYAPSLQVVVMTKRSDPRSGETTYRLTNINRSEPNRSLFEVPSDYTVKESPAFDMNYRSTIESLERRKKKDAKEENKQ